MNDGVVAAATGRPQLDLELLGTGSVGVLVSTTAARSGALPPRWLPRVVEAVVCRLMLSRLVVASRGVVIRIFR